MRFIGNCATRGFYLDPIQAEQNQKKGNNSDRPIDINTESRVACALFINKLCGRCTHTHVDEWKRSNYLFVPKRRYVVRRDRRVRNYAKRNRGEKLARPLKARFLLHPSNESSDWCGRKWMTVGNLYYFSLSYLKNKNIFMKNSMCVCSLLVTVYSYKLCCSPLFIGRPARSCRTRTSSSPSTQFPCNRHISTSMFLALDELKIPKIYDKE